MVSLLGSHFGHPFGLWLISRYGVFNQSILLAHLLFISAPCSLRGGKVHKCLPLFRSALVVSSLRGTAVFFLFTTLSCGRFSLFKLSFQAEITIQVYLVSAEGAQKSLLVSFLLE